MSMKESENWVQIAETIHIPQAVSWRDLLSGNGILVLVDPPVNRSEPYPLTALAVPMKIFVREDDESTARELLEGMATPIEE